MDNNEYPVRQLTDGQLASGKLAGGQLACDFFVFFYGALWIPQHDYVKVASE